MPASLGPTGSNVVLEAIEAESATGFRSLCKTVAFERGDVLCNTGDRLRHAYFPSGCVLSTLATHSDGSSLEVNIIGREGAYGLIGGFGSGEAIARVVVLVGGEAERVPMRHVRAEFERSQRVRAMIVRHAENLMFQMQQSAVCAARHSVEARLGRWLLAIHDRAPASTFRFTHEFVAGHLGANRTSVTLAAAGLQRDGLISYRRGVLRVTDRRGLEAAACECYRSIRERFTRLFR
jgi:CRP-like cAMP-binding protein